jgi:hypothetical protein
MYYCLFHRLAGQASRGQPAACLFCLWVTVLLRRVYWQSRIVNNTLSAIFRSIVWSCFIAAKVSITDGSGLRYGNSITEPCYYCKLYWRAAAHELL